MLHGYSFKNLGNTYTQVNLEETFRECGDGLANESFLIFSFFFRVNPAIFLITSRIVVFLCASSQHCPFIPNFSLKGGLVLLAEQNAIIMIKSLPLLPALLALALPLYPQQLLCVDLPSGVDNEQEEDCGCSEACFSDGICAPAGTGSCTEPGTSTSLVYDTETLQLSIPSNTDVEISIVSLECSGDLSTPGSYLEGNDNFRVETEQGDFNYRQDRHGGSFPSNFGNYVDETFCYGTGGSSETITIRLTGNRKDECLEITVNSSGNGGIPGSSGFSTACTVLAAEVTAFSVFFQSGTGVWIKWEIAGGQPPTTFYIERGTGPSNLLTIDSVDSAPGKTHYEYLDQAPFPGINYYRIRQEDHENSLYTAIAVVMADPGGEFNIINPVGDQLLIQIPLNFSAGAIDRRIFNSMGIPVPVRWREGGEQQWLADTGHLPPGIYVVQVCAGESCCPGRLSSPDCKPFSPHLV